jgi:triosephosphate isomerase
MVKDHILVGAQNISAFESGPYTGEVSAEHISDYGIDWVMIGHSERKNMFGETTTVKILF